MKAICYSRYGNPDVLHLEDVPTPEPGPGEILVKVRAAEATKSDCELRSFRYAVKWFWLPLRLAVGVRRPRRRILGGYFAGEIAALGPGVTGFALGDAVFGSAGLRLGAGAVPWCSRGLLGPPRMVADLGRPGRAVRGPLRGHGLRPCR